MKFSIQKILNNKKNIFSLSLIVGFIVALNSISIGQSSKSSKDFLFPYSIHLIEKLNYQSQPLKYYLDILTIGVGRMDSISKLSVQERLEKEGNVSMRIQAAVFLGRYRNKKAVYLLHKTLTKTVHPLLRSQCLDALARINDSLSVRYIENALLDKDNFVKNGLQMVEDAKKRDPRETKSFPEPIQYKQVKIVAAWALGLMNRKRSINSLVSALEDKNPDVRINAAYSLGELATAGDSFEVNSFSVRDHIKDIISKFNDENTASKYRVTLAYPMLKLGKNERKGYFYLAKSLLHPDDFTRALSAKVLGRLHDIRGLSPLEDASIRERSAWVNQEFSTALKQIKMFNQSYR